MNTTEKCKTPFNLDPVPPVGATITDYLEALRLLARRVAPSAHVTDDGDVMCDPDDSDTVLDADWRDVVRTARAAAKASLATGTPVATLLHLRPPTNGSPP